MYIIKDKEARCRDFDLDLCISISHAGVFTGSIGNLFYRKNGSIVTAKRNGCISRKIDQVKLFCFPQQDFLLIF